jgi:type II secretory pathway component GspD/PulD (secretin)
MKKLLCSLVFSIPLAIASYAQEPKQSMVFDVTVIDLDAGNAAGIESLVKNKASLDRLIADGKARVESSVQLRARLGEQAQARIGQRVPIQVGSTTATPAPGRPTEGSVNIATPQIQYENTGLNLSIFPTKLIADQIELKFNLDLSTVDRSTGTLTPSFVTRVISNIVQMRPGEPIVLISLSQPELRTGAPPSPSTGPSQASFAVLLTARFSN